MSTTLDHRGSARRARIQIVERAREVVVVGARDDKVCPARAGERLFGMIGVDEEPAPHLRALVREVVEDVLPGVERERYGHECGAQWWSRALQQMPYDIEASCSRDHEVPVVVKSFSDRELRVGLVDHQENGTVCDMAGRGELEESTVERDAFFTRQRVELDGGRVGIRRAQLRVANDRSGEPEPVTRHAQLELDARPRRRQISPAEPSAVR